MEKECIVLGFGDFENKETGEKMLRILLGIRSTNEKYKGIMVAPPVFLNYDEKLKNNLELYIEDNGENLEAFYTTTDNILTGKTKVSNIIIVSKKNFG